MRPFPEESHGEAGRPYTKGGPIALSTLEPDDRGYHETSRVAQASSLSMVVMSLEIRFITTIERLDLRKQTIRRLTTTTKRL